jgi:hypothetical protein
MTKPAVNQPATLPFLRQSSALVLDILALQEDMILEVVGGLAPAVAFFKKAVHGREVIPGTLSSQQRSP